MTRWTLHILNGRPQACGTMAAAFDLLGGRWGARRGFVSCELTATDIRGMALLQLCMGELVGGRQLGGGQRVAGTHAGGRPGWRATKIEVTV